MLRKAKTKAKAKNAPYGHPASLIDNLNENLHPLQCDGKCFFVAAVPSFLKLESGKVN